MEGWADEGRGKREKKRESLTKFNLELYARETPPPVHSIRGPCVWFNYFGSLRPASLFPNPEKRFLPLLLMSFRAAGKSTGKRKER